MSSNSEKTFGSRLQKAAQLANLLPTFSGYAEVVPECSIPNYQTHIQSIQLNNDAVASAASEFSLSVEQRLQLFNKNSNSLSQLLSPISSYIKAKFGKTSKQAKDIVTLINKIRGEKTTQLKKSAEGEFVSQSQRSFGSRTKHFSDIIAYLENYAAEYAPVNHEIRVASLKTLQTNLTNANNLVTTTYGQLKPLKDLRQVQYNDLSQRSTRIKNSIKSQFGPQSTEYKLIKGFKI